MKRDMDLIRELLLKVEEAHGKPGWKALTAGIGEERTEFVLKHLSMLREAGLIRGIPLNIGGYAIMENIELTWEGHDFIDAVRNSEVWTKTKKGAEAAGGFTLDLLKDLAKGFVKKQIEERTGVKL